MTLLSPTTVDRIHPPLQLRSQETLERILDAAEEIVARKGGENTTVSEIVREARSSVGAFYARFADKDALLRCLQRRLCGRAQAWADELLDARRWDGASARAIVADVVPALVRAYADDHGLIRAFLLLGCQDARSLDELQRFEQHVADRATELLLARRAEIGHSRPALAIGFAVRMIFDALNQEALFAGVERTHHPLSCAALTGELRRLVVGYLGIRETDPESICSFEPTPACRHWGRRAAE